MKRCTKCKSEKEITEFYYEKGSWCKECHNACKRARYVRKREQIIADGKEYYRANKETIQQKNKERHLKNKDAKNAYCRQYYLEHKDEMIKKAVQYELDRKKTDPAYRARRNLRLRVRSALKEMTFSKRTENMLGLTQSEFKKYIESHFEEGMTWENYGYRGWHLDHSIALSTANTIEEMEALCHYTNLKPMWGEENMRKGARPQPPKNE